MSLTNAVYAYKGNIVGAGGNAVFIAGAGGEDLYTKHQSTKMQTIEAFDSRSNIYDVLAKSDRIVAVNHRTNHSVAIIERATSQVTWISPCPTGTDATDKPADMTDFYNSGEGFTCRSIAETDDYYIIGIRYGGGVTADGTHLYGGIVFIDKTTKTVSKSYWLPYIISRVVYNAELNILAVGLQMAGLRFYSISGTTLTELATFTYSNGRESQHGYFYSANGREYYANVGFGVGVIFYDVTDSANITQVGEFQLKSYAPFNNSGSSLVHTYTGIVRFPYLYITTARHDEDNAHYDLDGVLTVDISDPATAKAISFEHVTQADAAAFNNFGDTKPTEMTCSHGMLYLNYENGYLAFEIEADGRSTHYCGKYFSTDMIYGINATSEADIFVGIGGSDNGYVSHIMEHVEWTVYQSLTHVSTNNTAKRIENNAAYSATLTTESGYEISNVTVLMGGVDITSTAYNNGVITIASVTGDISITVTASEVANYYWCPDEDGLSQYQNSKQAVITQNGNDVSMTMNVYNSGFKSIKNITAPTATKQYKLIADTVTFNQPSQTNDVVFSIKFMNSSDAKLKEYYYISQNTQTYLGDIVNGGITVTGNISDIANAAKIQVTLRSNAEDGAEHFPISVAFTNLRIELV